MIRCIDIIKDYHVERGKKRVLDGINFQMERGEKVGVLGRNGAGKSTLIRIIGGVELPTAGRIERDMSVSWPLAFGGAFQGSLSGLDNLRFISRIYNLDYKSARDYVDEFAELGSQLLDPVKTYSSGMRARLAFALSVIIEFDAYLIDEVIMVGDAKFAKKCQDELFVKRSDRALIIVSHDMGFIRETCSRSAVIYDKKLHDFSSVDEGIEVYNSL
ncbi:ATP-binding cassette domain-containing protein [Aristophania vespae]|uniref:ATP-binding cassette domain-containing protein n=1 Tax=Aristophania vespae TaxID=2697033 RepID=A0A6P1N9P9_9PROT|nr:ABC transporter ATP-binding protein [Aristophania vespae]QHI95136.1 ATP-binding cassette domain-containing protein [Aristophania vespae]UMM64350.1 Polysialic acid transport ATP-binding protein KpsT [Aristophania vespae]